MVAPVFSFKCKVLAVMRATLVSSEKNLKNSGLNPIVAGLKVNQMPFVFSVCAKHITDVQALDHRLRDTLSATFHEAIAEHLATSF